MLAPEMHEKSYKWSHNNTKILKMVEEEFSFSNNQKQSPTGALQKAILKSFQKLAVRASF